MRKNDQEVVLNLAEESARLDEFDSILLENASKLESSEIAGWNAEVSPFIIRSIHKLTPSSRISIKRKSNSEPPLFTSRPLIKTSNLVEKKEFSRERKLPVITPKVLVPKFHFVHAPFNINLSSRKALMESQTSLSSKGSEVSSPVKVTRSTFFPGDSKKNESDLNRGKPRTVVKVNSALD